MLSRVLALTVILLLWWTSATSAASVRPATASTESSAVEQIERLVVDGSPATSSNATPSDGQPVGEFSGRGDGGPAGLDMPAMLMALPVAPVFLATMSTPCPYTASAWLAPDLGVPQRPPRATTVVA